MGLQIWQWLLILWFQVKNNDHTLKQSESPFFILLQNTLIKECAFITLKKKRSGSESELPGNSEATFKMDQKSLQGIMCPLIKGINVAQRVLHLLQSLLSSFRWHSGILKQLDERFWILSRMFQLKGTEGKSKFRKLNSLWVCCLKDLWVCFQHGHIVTRNQEEKNEYLRLKFTARLIAMSRSD